MLTLTGFGLCLFATPLGAQWVALTVGLPAVSVDTSTSTRVDSLTSVALFRVQYASEVTMPGAPGVPPHRESRIVAEVRCRDASFRSLTMAFYDAGGRMLARTREASPWMRHEPPMIGALMVRGWCALRPTP